MKKLLFLFAMIILPMAGFSQSTFPITKIMNTILGQQQPKKLTANMKALGFTQVYREGDQYDEESTTVFTKACSSNKNGALLKAKNSSACVVYRNVYMDGGYFVVKFTNKNYLPSVRSYIKKHGGKVTKKGNVWQYTYEYGY